MNMLVIGLGEAGTAVQSVLGERYAVDGLDRDHGSADRAPYDVIHICFPFFEGFVAAVREYQKKYLSARGITIIHSTVPVGTSAQCEAVHSPIRGIHPHLVDGIKTFVKYFGGPRAEEAAAIFSTLGINIKTTLRAENTEALKLFDTTYYAWNVVFNKAVKEWCDAHGLDFDLIYTDANHSYNEGYAKLGRTDVARPVLKSMPGKIGGHCLIPNCELLVGSEIAQYILDQNTTY